MHRLWLIPLKTRLVNSIGLILLALTPGFLYFIVALPNANYGHLWSYANGMESPLSLFFFSLLFLLVVSRNNSVEKLNTATYFIVGFLISLVILTRLDDVFILVSFVFMVLVSKQVFPEKLKRCFYLCIVPIVLISCYMFLNNKYAGSALPTSGQAKGGLSLFSNGAFLVNGFLPLKPIIANAWNYWNETTWRALHNIVPLCIAVIFLVFYLRNYKGPLRKHFTQYDAFLASLALYVIFKGLYNFLLVAIWHQGHWYYPLSILITNVIIARGLSLFMMIRSFNDAHLTLSPKSLKFLFSTVFLLCSFVLLFVYSSIAPLNTLALTAVITSTMFGSISLTGLYLTQRKNLSVRLPYVLAISVLFVPLIGNSILSIKETTSYNQKYEIFFNNRENLKSALENLDPNFKFLSFDDGIIAYSLQSPTMSGLGFALDKEAYKSKSRC